MAAWSHNSASDHFELGGDRCQNSSGTKFPEAQGQRCPEGGREEKAQGLEKEGRVGIKCPARAHSPLRGQGVGGLYHKRQTSHMYRLGRDGEQRACTAPRRRNERGRGLVGIWLAIRLVV